MAIELLPSGIMSFPITNLVSGIGLYDRSALVSGLIFKHNINWDFFASGLDPNSSSVRVDLLEAITDSEYTQGHQDPDQVLGSGIIDVSAIGGGAFIWLNLSTNAQGDLNESVQDDLSWNNIIATTINRYIQWNDIDTELSSVLTMFQEDGDVGNTPFLVEDRFSAFGSPVANDENGGDRALWIMPHSVTYKFRIQDFVSIDKEVTIRVDFIDAFDIKGTGVQTDEDEHLLTIPVNFDTPLNQPFSPTNTVMSVDRAIIPYNNTTEREIVHMDYRVKSDEVTQNSLREIVLPYTVDDMTTLRVSTAGGGIIPITATVDNGDGTTTVTTSQDAVGTYYVGAQYEMQYKLGNLQIKPANLDGRTRNTNRATKDNLSTMTFAYADSRVFDVEITRPNRPVRIVEFVSTRIGFDDIGEAGLSTGTFRFHVRGKTDAVIITVKDNSVFPLQLQHVEIERNVTSRSKR